MKVIFLDIDGVLNSQRYFHATGWSENAIEQLDPHPIALIDRLCADTGARIVVSSSWRLMYERGALHSMLARRGLDTRVIIGATPAVRRSERGTEVQRWLDTVPAMSGITVDGMVIFDDDQDMLHLTPWLVRTPFETGLTDAHLLDARRVLTQAMPRTSFGGVDGIRTHV